jgi:phage I-like protein
MTPKQRIADVAAGLVNDQAPLRRRLEKALAQGDAADALQELRELVADLPQLLRRANTDADTARELEAAIVGEMTDLIEKAAKEGPGTGDRGPETTEDVMRNAMPMLNRSLPADGWVQVAPTGEYPHSETGLTQVLDDAALEAMVNSFRDGGEEILVDQDHFSYQPDKPSTAMGWIKELAKRSNGLWAKIDLTPVGREAIANGLYRFVSPVWARADCEDLGGGKVRPRRLDSVGLTNQPNLRGMVPLSNRATGNGPSGAETKPTHKESHMKDKLITALGLAADAADSAVVEAVTTLKNRAASLETANADLKKNSRELLEAQVETDLAQYADRIANKEAMRKVLLNDRKSGLEMLQALKPVEKPALHNRAGKPTPGSSVAKTKPQQIEEAVRSKMLANRCGYAQAWAAVQTEKPELFAEETNQEES